MNSKAVFPDVRMIVPDLESIFLDIYPMFPIIYATTWYKLFY
jgi:hypothetical protein